MACFLAPMALAIVTSIIQKTARSLAEKLKLWLLNAMLWGGIVLLAVEHIWHGEVTLWPPFLTAMANPADIPTMLHEIATIGTSMTLATVTIWGMALSLDRILLTKRIPDNALKKPKTLTMNHG